MADYITLTAHQTQFCEYQHTPKSWRPRYVFASALSDFFCTLGSSNTDLKSFEKFEAVQPRVICCQTQKTFRNCPWKRKYAQTSP